MTGESARTVFIYHIIHLIIIGRSYILIKKCLAFGIIILFISPVLASGINTDTKVATTDGNHQPIVIDGNDDFTSENGVTGGSGIVEDPFIIEDWIIVGNGSVSDGIFINNTDIYFVIRNCTVYDFHHPDEYYCGIEFLNVNNGSIEDCVLFTCHICINIWYSTNITINNCSCYDYPYLYGYGISCYKSKDITITSCRCYNLDRGIDLTKSSDIAVDNTISYDNNVGLGTWSLEPLTLRLVITNSKFYRNKLEGVVLMQREFHPTYSKIFNCEFYNNGLEERGGGLRFERCCNNIVENCSFHDNWQGISIKTDNNIVRNCNIFNHSREGIAITGFMGVRALTRNNQIINCDIYSNRIGIQFWTSVGSVAEKCNIYNNSWHGIYNGMFSMVRIKHNNIYENGYDEMYEAPCGMWSMWFCFIDARDNWWDGENGPRMYRFGYLGIIPIKIMGSEKIIRSRSIIMYRPWAKEPIPDAGVQ